MTLLGVRADGEAGTHILALNSEAYWVRADRRLHVDELVLLLSEEQAAIRLLVTDLPLDPTSQCPLVDPVCRYLEGHEAGYSGVFDLSHTFGQPYLPINNGYEVGEETAKLRGDGTVELYHQEMRVLAVRVRSGLHQSETMHVLTLETADGLPFPDVPFVLRLARLTTADSNQMVHIRRAMAGIHAIRPLLVLIPWTVNISPLGWPANMVGRTTGLVADYGSTRVWTALPPAGLPRLLQWIEKGVDGEPTEELIPHSDFRLYVPERLRVTGGGIEPEGTAAFSLGVEGYGPVLRSYHRYLNPECHSVDTGTIEGSLAQVVLAGRTEFWRLAAVLYATAAAAIAGVVTVTDETPTVPTVSPSTFIAAAVTVTGMLAVVLATLVVLRWRGTRRKPLASTISALTGVYVDAVSNMEINPRHRRTANG